VESGFIQHFRWSGYQVIFIDQEVFRVYLISLQKKADRVLDGIIIGFNDEDFNHKCGGIST